MIKVHRGEAKCTPMTDLQWTSTETKSSQKLNNSPFHSFTADAITIKRSMIKPAKTTSFRAIPLETNHRNAHRPTTVKFLVTKVHFFSRPLCQDYSEKPLLKPKPILTDPRTRLPADWLLCQPTRSQAENTCQSTGTSCQQHS